MKGTFSLTEIREEAMIIIFFFILAALLIYILQLNSYIIRGTFAFC